MELAVVVGAPIGVQPLQPFAGQCVAGVERGELEVAADHVVDGGEHGRVGIDEVEGRSLVAQIGEAAGTGFLVDFDAGVRAFFLAQLFKTGAQAFEPLVVDKAREYGEALVVEIGFVLLGQ